MSPDHPLAEVRIATPADAPILARLFEVFEAQTVPAAQVLQRMQSAQEIETAFLVEVEGRVVGVACLRLAPALSGAAPYAEVSELFVEKAFQDRDIERSLLASLEQLAARRGAQQIVLPAGMKNEAAQSLYRSLGYREYALLLRKHLNDSPGTQA